MSYHELTPEDAEERVFIGHINDIIEIAKKAEEEGWTIKIEEYEGNSYAPLLKPEYYLTIV